MAKTLKVSVIITILNEEKSIERLIVELLDQSLRPNEIIIVDGGSTDFTMNTLRRGALTLIPEYKKITRIFQIKGNRSVGRNFGIKKARNEIIAVTDAGGFPDKHWLERITKPFLDHKINVVSGYYKSLAKTSFEKSVTPYFLVMPDKIHPDMEFLPSSRSVAFRKSVWKKVGGYPEKFSHNEDLVFDYMVKKAGFKFYFALDAIVYWAPPKTLGRAFKTFYRFALGDAEAGIPRSKIKYIYLRYFVFVAMCLISYRLAPSANEVLLIAFVVYLFWSMQKNFRYVKMVEAVFWLPVIQVASDLAVMSGTMYGKIKK